MNRFHITLEARSWPRRIHRFWDLSVGPDLFKQRIIPCRWGRISTSGQMKIFDVTSLEEAQREVRARVQRRVSAPRRIGIGYHIVFLYDPEQWLEDELLKKFPKKRP